MIYCHIGHLVLVPKLDSSKSHAVIFVCHRNGLYIKQKQTTVQTLGQDKKRKQSDQSVQLSYSCMLGMVKDTIDVNIIVFDGKCYKAVLHVAQMQSRTTQFCSSSPYYGVTCLQQRFPQTPSRLSTQPFRNDNKDMGESLQLSF